MSKIPDLPKEERPRERLARLGAPALSDSELLAIFLRVGVKGASAIEVGRRLLNKYGGLSALGGLSVEALASEFGLGPAKAAQLLAAFELGSRSASERVDNQPMSNAQIIYDAVAPRLMHELNEHVVIMMLDAKLRVIRIQEISEGTIDKAICEPRDILHHVLIHRVKNYVLIHNHPSGDPAPSRQDIDLTNRLLDASKLMNLRLLDHVVIGKPSTQGGLPYYSFASQGRL